MNDTSGSLRLYFSSLGPPLFILMDQSKTQFPKADDFRIQKPRQNERAFNIVGKYSDGSVLDVNVTGTDIEQVVELAALKYVDCEITYIQPL